MPKFEGLLPCIATWAALGALAGEAEAQAVNCTVIATSGSTFTLQCGQGATAAGGNAIALGTNANAQGGIAIGGSASAPTADSIAIGELAVVNPSQGIGGIAIGHSAQTTSGVSIGNETGSGDRSVAVGVASRALGTQATAAGYGSTASANGSTAFGASASATAQNSTALGAQSDARGENSLAVGWRATATHANSAAIGSDTVTTRDNQIVLGNSGQTVTMAGVLNSSAQGAVVGIVTIDGLGNLGADTTLYSRVASTEAAAGAMQANIVVLGTAAQQHATSIDTLTIQAQGQSASISTLQQQYGQLNLVFLDQAGDIAALQDNFRDLDGAADYLTAASRLNSKRIDVNTEGVALGLAMAGAGGLLPGERGSFSIDGGTYQGTEAMSVSSALRLSPNLSVSAGVGAGLDSGTMGGRAGLRFGW